MNQNVTVKKFSLLFLLLFLAAASVWAQVFPVQATTQLSPPYSLYLADYVASGSERLALNVYLADIARPQLDVRFRLRIVGQGITIETKQEYRPAPVSIQGGVPLRLISTDLADYFNVNNLNFQGITRREYEQRGKLPEGVYQFCFEVLEYNRGVKISNTACAIAWLILNDPPIINLPGRDEKLKAQSPQNVLLQWTPRHTGSPNSAFTTEYEVTMVEVWPSTRNPNDAILTSPPILQTTTANTTFIYGPAETPLEPGRRYAFRVKAKSIAGVDELDLFKNNGYSEVYSFIYGDACDLPTGISVSAVSPTKFTVAWQGTFNQTAFRVRYREVGTAAWYDSNVSVPELQITSLKPGTTYEYQVAATCGFFDGQYATSGKVTTMELPEAAYACNNPMQTFDLDPAQLTGSLKVGDVIDAGDFNVKLTKISGSNGVFSGEGVVEVPYFNKAKIRTSFTSISVNKEMRMVNGVMNVTGGGVDIVPQELLDGLDKLEEVLDVVDSALSTVEENLPKDFDPDGFVADTLITVKDGIHSVYKNDDGSVVVVDKSGNTQTLPPGSNYAVKDNAGNGYLIDSKGNIHKTTADIAAKAGSREYKLELNFGPAPLAKNGFDPYKHKALEKDYEHLKDNYSVAWKAVPVGGSDPVVATLKSTSLDKSKIRFELGGDVVSTPPFTGQETTVPILGQSGGDTQSLLAIYPATDSTGKDQVLGKLNVATYAEIVKSVVIVPVGDVTVPEALTAQKISTELNKIYGQAVVNWRVSIADRIQHTLPSPFDDGESGILSNYTGDMKAVIKAFGNLQDETFYLFLVRNPKSFDALGYMPRSKQAGFIFMDKHADTDAIVRTMAHELGHGAFNLHHIFQEPNFTLTQGNTDNLMDYPMGDKLYKYQWDKMRFKDIVMDVFEDDEEGEARISIAGIQKDWRNPDNTVSFMAPNGKLVRLPVETTQAYFTFGIGEYTPKEYEMLPAGLLDGFEITKTVNDKPVVTKYIATWMSGKFLGYYADPQTRKEPAPLLPKGESAAQGVGVAVIMTYHAKGVDVVRFSGLPNEHMATNPSGDSYIDLFNVGAGQINASASTSVEKFTYENNQIAYNVSATSPRPEYAGMYDILGSDDDRKMSYWLTTKIYEYRIVYPDVFNKMTVNFGDWSEMSVRVKTISNDLLVDPYLMNTIFDLPKEQLTAGYFEYYLAKKGMFLEAGKPEQKQLVLLEFLKEFRTMIDHQKEINKKAIQLIATSNYCAAKAVIASLDPIEIRNAIEAMSTEDLKLICADARAHLVGTILEAGVVSNSLERAIYKLMWTCPEESKAKAMFLQSLAGETDNDNEYILGKMVRAIDDQTMFMGANFNTMVMNYVIRAYGDYMKYAISNPGEIKDKESQKEIEAMSKLSPEAIKYLDKAKLKDFQNKIITYNYVGFTKRLFKEVMITLCEGCRYAFDPNTKSIVEYKEATGTLTYTNKAVQGFTTVSESTPLPLRALQPIMLDDKAKLIDVYASSKEDGGMFIPAITLYFIEKKADAKTTAEGIGTAVDLASLAIPGANATLALKLLNYADKLSSVASLVGNASNDDYPKLAQFLQISSAVLGGINLVGGAMVPKLDDLKALKDVNKAVDAIVETKGFMEAEKHLEEVHKLCDRITAMDPKDKDLMDMLNHGKEERKLLIKALELEKSAASAAENSAAVTKLEGAIKKLNGYQNAANGIAALSKTEKLKTVFSRMVKTLGDKFVKTADNRFLTKGNVQIASLNKDGELVFEYLGDMEGLSASAKLEENVADAAFYTKGKTTETVDDILIFDDNGVIKCVSGTNCFVAGTPVHMKQGVKPIQQVAVGDIVKSYDEAILKNVWQRVTNVFSKKTKKLQRIISGRDTLWATPEHRFFEKTRGWVTAAALSTTMLLHTADGYAAIKSNVSVDTIATVYNFTVQNTHTYYVGRQTILTHNDCHAIGQFLAGLGDKQPAFLATFGKQKYRSIVEKFASGQFDISLWDTFVTLGLKEGDVAAFFGKIDGWDKNLLGKLAADLKNEASLKAVLSNLDGSKKLAALDAWAAIAKGSKMSTLSKADMAAVISRMVSFGDEAGKFNPARVQAFTDKFVGMFGALEDAAPRNNLVALLKQNGDVKVFEVLTNWDSNLQKTFLTGLLAEQKTLSKGTNFLSKNLSKLDEELMLTFERLGGLAPIKRYDYDLLLSCKNKFGDELIDIVGQETRAKAAAKLLETHPLVSKLIGTTNYRDNLRKSIVKLYKDKKKAANLDAFINMYAKDTDLFEKLTDLKKLPSDQLEDAIEKLFKTDFNAHHILPVNMLYNNNVCTEIMEWALKSGKTDFFHDIDNLMFLRNINHTAGTYGHNVYDKLFAAHLDNLRALIDDKKYAKAYQRMTQMVNDYKNHIANSLIGTPQKLDDLTGLSGL